MESHENWIQFAAIVLIVTALLALIGLEFRRIQIYQSLLKQKPAKQKGMVALLKVRTPDRDGVWQTKYIVASRDERDFLSIAKYEYVSGNVSINGRIGIEYDNGMVFVESDGHEFYTAF